MAHLDNPYLVSKITGFSEDRANRVVSAWRDLFVDVVTRFRDGYIISDIEEPTISIKKMFYPRWWLEKVGFFGSEPNKNAEILFQPNKGQATHGICWVFDLLLVLSCITIGFIFGRTFSRAKHFSKNADVQSTREYSSLEERVPLV